MGLRMSKISYNMSEIEKKLGYASDDCDEPEKACGSNCNADTETAAPISSSSSNPVVAESAEPANQYQSNSSLSSIAGETSCIHLSWPKSATDSIFKRRKGIKATDNEESTVQNAGGKAVVKKPKKNSLLKGIGGNLKKKESPRPMSSVDEDASVTLGASALPSTSSTCVCTGYRRTSDGNQPVPGLIARARASEHVPSGTSSIVVLPGTRLASPRVLGVFNPNDYPIEDEDDKLRRQRAKEMAEGVEVDFNTKLILGLNKGKHDSSHKQAHSQVDYIHCLVPDLKEITSCSFYWGKIDRYAAEKLLEDKPEGTFLLRDSAQEEYLFSVSFRRYGRSLHARIEQWNHSFSFDAHDPSVFSAPTVTGLIEHYKDPNYCMFFEPMLTIRLHRNFTFSLQHIARSAICNQVTYDSISALPLPKQLKAYCREYHFKQKYRTRNFPE